MSTSSNLDRAQPFAAAAYAQERRREVGPAPEVMRLRSELRALRGELSRRPEGEDLRGEIVALRGAIQELAPGSLFSPMLRERGIDRAAWPNFERALTEVDDEEASLDARFRDAIARMVRPVAWPLASGARSAIGLVGPSGVGKTTTVAKLAARAVEQGRSVALVTCDVFRVGALDQLRRFAAFLDVRCILARTRDEVAEAIESADEDVVITDTAGCTVTESSPEMALASQPGGGRERRVALCLPAATRWTDAARAVRIYGSLAPTEVIATKLDETDLRSGIVHASCASGLPVSTLTFGHRVPEDIAPATTSGILDALMFGAPTGSAS